MCSPPKPGTHRQLGRRAAQSGRRISWRCQSRRVAMALLAPQTAGTNSSASQYHDLCRRYYGGHVSEDEAGLLPGGAGPSRRGGEDKESLAPPPGKRPRLRLLRQPSTDRDVVRESSHLPPRASTWRSRGGTVQSSAINIVERPSSSK